MRIAVAAAFGILAVSCQNELLMPEKPVADSMAYVNPVKEPVFYAWTGDQSLYEIYTRSLSYSYTTAPSRLAETSDAQVNVNFFKIVDFENADRTWLGQQYPELAKYIDNAPSTTDRGEYVSQHEFDVVMAYLAEHPDEGSTECNLSTYFIQNVGSSKDQYSMDYMTEEGNVHHSQSVIGGNQMDYLTINGAHIPDYNATDGKRALVIDIPVSDPTYHDSYGDQDNTKYDAYRYYYIEVDGVVNCYLCFDYRMKKYDNGMCDYQGDKVYSDWVIKLVPADGSQIVPPSSGNIETPSTGNTDWTPKDEVEINLSILDSHEYDIKDLVSKLSIHVRAATDVEVFIPVPAMYYCDMDDLNVMLKHEDELMSYGKESVASYEIIPGHTVTVTVTFADNGIKIITDGIDEDIIAYCKDTYGDGVNFEIWNYFNNVIEIDGLMQNAVTREQLQVYLNNSTVKFLDKVPDMFVNAFHDDENENIWPGDCTVTPVDEQINYFDEPYEGPHYNASEYNQIYVNKEAGKTEED